MSTEEPCLAVESDIERIDALLYSAEKELSLPPAFFCGDNNPQRLRWLQEKIRDGLIWVIRDQYGLAGVLILTQKPEFLWLHYMVVAERLRGKHLIGPSLIEKAKTLDCHLGLKAEATNRHSRRLVEQCGFKVEPEEYSRSGHPIFVWSRS
jgi:hypothetical protein